MAPIVHGLEAKYADRINFVYLDIDDPATNELKSYFGFSYQPDFFLLDGDGTILKRWVGPVSAEEFEATFAAALGG